MKTARRIVPLLLLFLSISSFSQKIVLDYWVDYEIESKGKKDTITIGFNKSGDYVYTDSELLSNSMKRAVFKGKNKDFKHSEMHVVLDLRNQLALFVMALDRNQFFMKMALENFMAPFPKGKAPLEGVTKLHLDKTNNHINIEKKDYRLHHFYADTEADKKIDIAFSEKMKFDNGGIFNTLLMIAAGSEKQIEFPEINGVILYIAQKDKILIKAVKTYTNSKTLDINYSYKITK